MRRRSYGDVSPLETTPADIVQLEITVETSSVGSFKSGESDRSHGAYKYPKLLGIPTLADPSH